MSDERTNDDEHDEHDDHDGQGGYWYPDPSGPRYYPPDYRPTVERPGPSSPQPGETDLGSAVNAALADVVSAACDAVARMLPELHDEWPPWLLDGAQVDPDDDGDGDAFGS